MNGKIFLHYTQYINIHFIKYTFELNIHFESLL